MMDPIGQWLKNSLKESFQKPLGWISLGILFLLPCIGPAYRHFYSAERIFFGRDNLEIYLEEQLPQGTSYSYLVGWLDQHGISFYDPQRQKGFIPLGENGESSLIYIGPVLGERTDGKYELIFNFTPTLRMLDMQLKVTDDV